MLRLLNYNHDIRMKYYNEWRKIHGFNEISS